MKIMSLLPVLTGEYKYFSVDINRVDVTGWTCNILQDIIVIVNWWNLLYDSV